MADEGTGVPIADEQGTGASVVDVKALKRAEIAAKVEAQKLEIQKQESQRANYFGEHPGISCDGCGCKPMIGSTVFLDHFSSYFIFFLQYF